MKRKRNIKEEQAKKEPVAQDEERDNRNNNYLDLQNFFKAPDQISSDDVVRILIRNKPLNIDWCECKSLSFQIMVECNSSSSEAKL
jgi:hypothetical protein